MIIMLWPYHIRQSGFLRIYSPSTNALRYYVSHQARTTVNAVWKEVQRAYDATSIRSWIEVIALDDLFPRPERRRGQT